MIEDWKKLTDKITQEWIKKCFEISEGEDLDYYWVANQVGTVFEFADYWVSFENVLDCYNYDVSKENFFNWYDKCLSDSSFQLSLTNFILKPKELKEQERLGLERSKENLKFAEEEFKKLIESYEK